MATEEIEISQLELADEILADMVTPVETATETKAVTLSQLRKWLGSSLPTGFIIASIGKMNDSRFTLLDGKTLSRTGTYEDFCNKVIEQVNAGNWFSCTQSEYDEDLSKYGQCGRFVIETDYIRIPTLGKSLCSGVVNGTIPVFGNGMTLGLTNGSQNVGLQNYNNAYSQSIISSGSYGTNAGTDANTNYATSGKTIGITTDPTKSGIEGKINSVEVYYYMVVSTEGQTDPVEIDINKVYEDLNLKANKDLSDVSQAGKTTVVGWGMPDYSAGVSKSKGVIYQAECDGFLHVFGTQKDVSHSAISLDIGFNSNLSDAINILNGYSSPNTNLQMAGVVPITKGMYYRLNNITQEIKYFRFYPLKGVI